MELVEKMTRRPTDQPWEQTTNPLGSFGSGVVIPVWGGGGGGGGGGFGWGFFFPVSPAPSPPPPPPLTVLNRFTLDDDKDEA